MMKYVARHMIDRGGGGAHREYQLQFGLPGAPITHRLCQYARSKAGIVQLTRSAAAELGKYDINVDAIAPGITATGMTRVLSGEEALQRVVSSGPLENLFQRVLMPEDVAAAIVFLCLPARQPSDNWPDDSHQCRRGNMT